MSAGEHDRVAVDEQALVFDCQGSELLGMVHRPARHAGRGLLCVVAGGPQYRGGVARGQVDMARVLSAHGVPVMRFDYRGIGDSEGPFRGYPHVEPDLRAAIAAFQQAVPGLQEIVLWGGCDAASAIMINAWKFPQVVGMAVGNPWVHSEELGDQAAVAHYRRRLLDKDFWLKVARLQYDPREALGTLARNLRSRVARKLGAGSGTGRAEVKVQDDPGLPPLLRMRLGLERFKGDVLLVISGRSLQSKEFDGLLAVDAAWQQAIKAPRSVQRSDLPEADHNFSSVGTREQLAPAVLHWLQALPTADHRPHRTPLRTR